MPSSINRRHAARVGAPDDEVGDTMSERIGLSGSRAGNDEKRRANSSIRRDAVLDGPALLRIEAFQILIVGFCEHESPHVVRDSADSLTVATTNVRALSPCPANALLRIGPR